MLFISKLKYMNLQREKRGVPLKNLFVLGMVAALASGCSSNSKTSGSTDSSSSSSTASVPNARDFYLDFKAVVGDLELNCDDLYTGLGPDGDYSFGFGDVRFYVSNLQLFDSQGTQIEISLNDTDFQLNHAQGTVALIDFSDKESGYCELANEGTPRVNSVITGAMEDADVASISFDVGVPQALMKAVIGSTDVASDSPSPLGEMYWSWASGYRHLVVNYTSMDATNTLSVKNSDLHLGSRNCGGVAKALDDQDECGLINVPKVYLDNFDIETNSVVIDLSVLVNSVEASHFYAQDNFGLQCHTMPMEPVCGVMLPVLGLNMETGEADASANSVFRVE